MRCNSTGAPTSLVATDCASSNDASGMTAKDLLLDIAPAWTDDVRRVRRRGLSFRKQDTDHLGGKARIGQHLLQIVDEVATAERRNPRKLVGARVLEEDALDR